MTTAHRPTFDPAVGKEAPKGPAYHQRLLPAHTQLKFRKPGQGGDADNDVRDLRSELLAAEAAHFAKVRGGPAPALEDASASDAAATDALPVAKRRLLAGGSADADADTDDPEAKRRRILEETRDIDADDSDSDNGKEDKGSDGDERDDDDDKDDDDDDDDDSDSDSSEEDSDDEDETAELQRELEKIKRERAEKREREEREKAAIEAEARERDIARGNPLLNKPDFTIKRRWDDDVVFKNQARGTDKKGKQKEFINDLLRSDFHKRFMNKYVR
ncbi:Cwf15/Cwc15 cell cycle control protein [Niveomyces insectorum RCEF 264]|uniref:Cwf15/Cwc15 cell cycle control protein n=1 Tax=Niveomyces insectorum RCEF 264 TaxID=1081102 RepID=A0A167ZWV3_9HYPO|nr:Cwf15/Cwc15 cell cycle control protein [Niveomyces insectorum RCEF 264]